MHNPNHVTLIYKQIKSAHFRRTSFNIVKMEVTWPTLTLNISRTAEDTIMVYTSQNCLEFSKNVHIYRRISKTKKIMTVPHGVPQGSVLGPLLFLIYINDLHNAIKYSKVYHFADDTNLFISVHPLPKIGFEICIKV